MTDRPPDPQPDPASTPEGAEDLDDAALAAAADDAEATGLPEATLEEGAEEYDEDEFGPDEPLDVTGVGPAAGAGAAAGAALGGRGGRTFETEERHLSPAERRAARLASRTTIPIDPALRIKDRASSAFVLASVGIFALILAYGVFLGHGGILTPLPTPTPVVTEGPDVSATPGASESVAPSAGASAAPSAPAESTAPSSVPSPSAAAS